MKSEWRMMKLGDMCKISSSKRIFAKEYCGDGIPFYRGKEIIEKHKGYAVSTELFISEERYEQIKEQFDVPKIGDILLSSVGTLGIPWLVDEEKFYFKDGNLTWLRAGKGLDNKFLYLWLCSPEAKRQIDAKCIGSTQKAITIQALNKFDIRIPDIDTQRKISDLLFTINNKINLNDKMNRNLKQQLHTFYMKMFTESAMDAVLGDVVVTTSGGTPSRKHGEYYDHGNICWVKSKELCGDYLHDTEEHINELAIAKSSAKLLPSHSVLIAMYGATVGAYGIISQPMACNQAVCAVLSNEKYPYTYLFQVVCESQQILINLAVGSAQQNISQVLIKQLPIHSNENIIQKFHTLARPIHEKLETFQDENRHLAEMRDCLLPKLMSGELDVSSLDL